MINLLPPERKKLIRAARSNVILVRYIVFLLFAIAASFGIFGVGYMQNLNERELMEQQLEPQNLKMAQYSQVIQQAEQYHANLATAKAILSNEITFSRQIISIAKAIPGNAVLASLELSRDSINKDMTLNLMTTSTNNAVQIKNSLEASDVFDNVRIVSTSIESNNTSGMPAKVVVTARLLKAPEGVN